MPLNKGTKTNVKKIALLRILPFYRRRNKRKRKDRQILGSCLKTEKVVEYEGDGDTNCNRCTWNDSYGLGEKTGRTGNQRKNRDHQKHNIVKIGQNTGKSLGNLKKLAVTQNPARDHPLTLV